MQFILQHLGVAVAAITGVLAARGKQVDLFGVLVLALVTALGGGTIRDLALGARPVFWVGDGSYVYTALGTALATFCIARALQVPRLILMLADACALAFFTMVGVEKALQFAVEPHIAVAMGVITGVAGGMCRDVLTREIPLVFRSEIYLYATAAMFGAIVFVGLEKWFPANPANMPVGTAITLILRLAALRWKWVLPVYSDRGDG